MACRWQIRHKLMIGLGLVVGIMSLLLAGILHGLAAYRATMNSVDSKLVELSVAQKLKTEIALLPSPPDRKGPFAGDEKEQLRYRSRLAQDTLAQFQEQLQVTLVRRRDPDKGENERGLLPAFQERFANLERLIVQLTTPQVGMDPSPDPLYRHPLILEAVSKLDEAAMDLHNCIYDDLYKRIGEAKRHYKNTLIIVLSTSIVGVLLMTGLLRFFYRWTFSPIRELQRGVDRVAEGDFDHRIDVHSGDELEALAAAFNDMTSRLQEMYRDLARQVNERSRQLVRSERLASVGFLAAGVAHEINNPLASILFCGEALERRLRESGLRLAEAATAGANPQSNSEVIARYLKMIQDEACRCKKITQRLLDFSRSGENRREPTDMTQLIQSVLDVAQHLEDSRGKEVVFQPPGRLVAWVNAEEIKSVILNLVVNALQSMDEGGKLTITLGKRDGMAEMVFGDTGCGMPPEVLENIFEPFYTRSRTGNGTGLGLSISHRVISQHGGEIEAVSPGVNQGSTFTVRLPLKPAESVKEDTLGHIAA